MQQRSFSCAALLGTLITASVPAQLHLGGRAGSYPGVLALELDGAAAGAPAAILLGPTPGPIPLRLIDPGDPRQLRVGPTGLVTLLGLFLPPANRFAPPVVAVPNDPSFLDAAVFAQGFTWPGATTTLGALSQAAPFRLAPAGQFRDRNTQFITPRAFFPVIRRADGTRMLAGGGQGALLAQIAAKTTEVYDPIADQFVAGPDMTTERSLHTATELQDGRILLAGGVDALNDPSNSAEIYDPVTDRFAAIASMRFARAGHVAVPLPGGRVLVTGGLSFISSTDPLGTINSTVQETEIYDPTTNAWSLGPRANVARAGHAAVELPDGRLLMAGGVGWTRFLIKIPGIQTSTEIYDPATNQISAGASMGTARALFPMLEIAPGQFLAAGGANALVPLGAPTAAVEIYTANTGGGTWTPIAPLAAARTLHAAAGLGSGKVLVFGGGQGDLNNPVALSATEVFDVSSRTWSAGPGLPSPRAGFGVYENEWGQLHILGGGTNPSGAVDNLTAWYYP